MRLNEIGLELNNSKCHYYRSEIDYLGVRIFEGTMKANLDKVKAIEAMKPPETKKEVQEFMGLVNFYREFCPGLAETAEPLYKLTHKATDFNWTTEHQTAFDKVKQLVTKPPLLRIPDQQRQFIISSDASGIALGAVLSQVYNGNEHPVSFASRVLSDAEKNYSVIEKELLAIVFAVKKFRCYIYGTRFIVQCDHNPLKYMATMKDPTKRISRWLMYLQDFNFEIRYRPGARNCNADCLSAYQD